MNNHLTEIVYILDRSGSMNCMQEAAITGFNQFLQSQLDEPGDVNFSLILFDNEYLKPYDRCPLQEARPLDASTYVPRGSTALLDAIGQTIDELGQKLAAEPEDRRPGKVIVAIYTDGEENSSKRYDNAAINQRITHQREKYAWEFMFLAANQDAIATATRMGIDRNMASVSEHSMDGVISVNASFARKSTALRKRVAYGQADPDYHKSLDQIREEEETKRKKKS